MRNEVESGVGGRRFVDVGTSLGHLRTSWDILVEDPGFSKQNSRATSGVFVLPYDRILNAKLAKFALDRIWIFWAVCRLSLLIPR